MPPDKRTQIKLEYNGKTVRVGDRETGIWICDSTGWYQRGRGYVYLKKGTRFKATWEFCEGIPRDRGNWKLVQIDLEQLLPPKLDYNPTWRRRLWWWFFPWVGPT